MAKKTETAKNEAPAAKGKGKAGQAAATTGAKVGKVAGRTAQAAPAKPAKASGQGQAAKPRGQFAGKGIKVLTPKGENVPIRGGALVRYEAITRHKRADDAIGSAYRIEGEDADRTITSADLAYLVGRGLIAVE